MGLLFYFRVESLNEPGHNLAAICAFEQRFFDGEEEGIHFGAHGVPDVSDFGLPVAVMENADEGFGRASFKMLLFAEIHKLRARSQRGIADGATALRLQRGCLKFVCHNEFECMVSTRRITVTRDTAGRVFERRFP